MGSSGDWPEIVGAPDSPAGELVSMPPPPLAPGRNSSGGPPPVPTGTLRIASTDGVELEAHLTEPEDDGGHRRPPGVIFLHGFPSGEVWADRIGADLPELVDRTAQQMGFVSLTVRFRGCGTSTGHFSLQGWVDDATAAIDHLVKGYEPNGLWVCGFGTGGAVAVVAAVARPQVLGVAMAGSPADFVDWAENPDRLLSHARRVGAIKGSDFPSDVERWKAELHDIRAVHAAEQFTDRALLVLHGSEDEAVPHFDARLLADAHGDAEFRFIRGAGHLLRHDPRAVAVLLGWLARQQGGNGPNGERPGR